MKLFDLVKNIKRVISDLEVSDIDEFNKLFEKMIKKENTEEDIEKLEIFKSKYLDKIFNSVKENNEKNENIDKLFLEACKSDNIEQIRRLYEKREQIDFTYIDENGNNCIMYLAKNKRNIINTIFILKKDLGYSIINKNNESFILFLYKNYIKNQDNELKEKIMNKLFKKTSIEAINHRDNDGLNLFFYMCKNKDFKYIHKLLEIECLDVNCIDKNTNETVIHYLIKYKNTEDIIIKLLKDFELFYDSLFMDSIKYKHQILANILFDTYYDKINIKKKDDDRSDCLMLSIICGFNDLSIKLINSGKININHIDNEGQSSLTYACQDINEIKNDNVVLELIKNKDLNVNHQNSDNNTGLMYLIEEKCEKLALELLKRDDIDVSLKNEYNLTVLLIAVSNNLEKVAFEILKKRDPKPSSYDIKNRTVIYWSLKNNMYNLSYELIKNHDCSPYLIENEDLNQPILYACKNNMEDIVLILLEDKRVEWWKRNGLGENILDYIFKKNMDDVIFKVIEIMSKEYFFENIDKIKKYIKESNTMKRHKYIKHLSKKLNTLNGLVLNDDICIQLYEYI